MTNKTVKQWFEVAAPEPTNQSFRVQLGCHFEEVAEMLEQLGGHDKATEELIAHSQSCLELLSTALKSGSGDAYVYDRKELLDSICDQQVTGIGVAHMLGMDVDGAMAEVNHSNWSKFVDGKPVFNEQGKIAKGPDYKAPSLGRFV